LHRHETQGNPERPSGIEGVEMRKVYYNRMRIPSLTLLFVLFVTIASTFAAGLSDPPPQGAIKAASLESHEGLTISALAWIDPGQYKDKFPKKSPYTGGVLAIQVEFRNDSNEGLRINLERIRLTVQLGEENRQEVQSLTSEQLADAVMKPAVKDPSKRPRLPIPVGGGKSGRDKHWMELQKQAQEAQVPSSVIGAHSSVQGLLYFDLQGQYDLLQSAHLYVPDIASMQGTHSLTYFDIDLSRRGSQ
jgi:hypothetical protein